ncbi:DUF5979 domain-containing protein [Microbacterium halotolerans]|uniref:DUF5979 domain-containing protein n=1 Tax=Microbacterium halotolerans TaxID=246613 RepID=UPI000E6AE0F8|nr:DUF5979 domain-containing protein [Microbacterium halotolerans]
MRIAVAVFAVVVLLATGVVFAPQTAHAATNPGIVVSGVQVESSDGGQATVGDVLTVSGEWDATDANPQPGETFTIGLPRELGFDQAVPFSLTGQNSDGMMATWAECLTDPTTGEATCTLTDAVVDYPDQVTGTFEFEVRAVESTTEEDVVFDLNGVEISVELPGDGGIDDGIEVPDEWSKSGEMNANRWSMSWTIDLPGAGLAGQDIVNVFEDLSENHVLCEASGLTVTTVYGDDIEDVSDIATVSTEVADPYDFSIALEPGSEGFDSGVLYRITYDTCTPDGEIDEKGTEYTNEAHVDVWGESSGVIGVEQPWSISDTISKNGSVLGGGQRNGAVGWTVTVPGDVLVGKESFTLSEALTGEHEVCSDTISGIRIVERYGPSGDIQSDITGDLTATAVSQSSDAFEVEFALADASDDAFKGNDWMYIIRYDTCVTTDGLPEAGTEFGNSADVDGSVATTTADAPARSEGKSGRINGSTVTIDGVDHLPQTTMDWRITVPGENLDQIEGELTVSDVLSDSHQVCTADDGPLSDRLALRVRAIDQIDGGGLAAVDLTDSVASAANGNELTFTIPEPTLPLPDGSEATGFSREYAYVIDYTTCTTSGGMDAPGTTYGNDATVAGKSYSRTVEQSNSGSGTGTGVARGSVAVTKSLEQNAAAELVPEATTFTVHAKEIDPSGTVQNEYDLSVPLNGDPVSGFTARGDGWTIELTEPAFPNVPGVSFGAPTFEAADGVTVSEDGTAATAALRPTANIAVGLTNTAVLGAVQVTKAIDGAAADLVDPEREFPVTAAIDVSGLDGVPEQDDREIVLMADEAVTLNDIPVGAVVTFSEDTPATDDAFTWGSPTIAPAEVEIGPESAQQPAMVTVTNHVERTVGTFSVAKQVEGAESGSSAVPDEFTVVATWNQEGVPGEKTLTLPADGTEVPLGEDLLIGTEVALVEQIPADGDGIAWSAPIWEGPGVETAENGAAIVAVGRDADAAVTVTNHAATSTAGISLIKGVAGEAAGEVDPTAEFPVTASWTDAEGVEHTVDLLIGQTEPTPLGAELPAGTVVTITEHERPTIDTVDWGPVSIVGDGVDDNGDGSAEVIVSDQQDAMALVTVTNEATWAPGGFSIVKSIEGVATDDPEVPAAVTVVAEWDDANGEAQTREIVVATDGTPTEFEDALPHGTAVTLTEVPLADSERFSWGAPMWQGERVSADGASAVVTIGAADVASVTLVNRAAPSLGAVAITKELQGTGAGAVGGVEYPVTLTWTDLLGETETREVLVTADAPAIVADVPVGTDISVAEGRAALPEGVRWQGASWKSDDQATIVSADGAEAVVMLSDGHRAEGELELTNTLTKEPGLAVTGTDAAAVAAVGAAGLLIASIGAGLFVLRRRRT